MLLCYILGLAVMALLCWLVSLIYRAFPGLADLNWVASMIPPFFLMILAILCHKMAKGRTPGYLGSYLLNAAGSGCAIGVLLGNVAVIPPPELLPALLPRGVGGGVEGTLVLLRVCVCERERVTRSCLTLRPHGL